jgi:hypothetical protein
MKSNSFRVRSAGILLIRAYQWFFSPLFGPTCRFHPSCSHYAIAVIERFGIVRGGWMTLKRLGRCHPWNPGGIDPPPEVRA